MTVLQSQPVLSRTPVRDEDLPPADDPFFYGWRVVSRWVNGIEEDVQVPLTLEDVLHPQPEDFIMQNKEHFELCKDLFNGLESHLAHEAETVLLHDTLIDWEEPGKKGLCPDLAVIRGVQTRFPKGVFSLKQSRGHVDLVLEVTSPSTWKVDVAEIRKPNKVLRYAKAGVPFYIIVDDVHRREGQSPPMKVYHLEKRRRYERVVPDERGWFWIETVGLWIGPYGDWVSWYDEKGKKLGTHLEVTEAYKRAERQARMAEHQARMAEHQARMAEHQAHDEAEARRRAEDKAQRAEDKAQRAEDKAQRAEQQAHDEADARRRAEQQAHDEADARRRAEARIRELEALLRT